MEPPRKSSTQLVLALSDPEPVRGSALTPATTCCGAIVGTAVGGTAVGGIGVAGTVTTMTGGGGGMRGGGGGGGSGGGGGGGGGGGTTTVSTGSGGGSPAKAVWTPLKEATTSASPMTARPVARSPRPRALPERLPDCFPITVSSS